MEREFLSLEFWGQFKAAEARKVAKTLSYSLPEPWRFRGTKLFRMGGQKRHVALFDWEKVPFALIPGGEATLGYDRKTPFVPSKTMLESWEHTLCGEAGDSLAEYLRENMTPLRRVTIQPLLVEVRAREWSDIEFLGEGPGKNLPGCP